MLIQFFSSTWTETNGTTVNDASGLGNDGTATGTTIADGRFGMARSFNGSGESIAAARSAIPESGDFTVETWVYGKEADGYREIVSQGESSNAMYIGYDPGLIIRAGDGWLSTAVYFPFDKWHHIAVAKTNSNTFLYIDGVLVATRGLPIPNPVTTLFWVGKQYGTAGKWDGLVDEIRVSNIARSPEEFNLQLPPKNLSATVSGTTVNLSWQNGGGAVPLMRYKIYCGIDSTNVSLVDSTTATSITNSVSVNGTYYYRISAVDSTGFEGAKSIAASATMANAEKILRLAPYAQSGQFLNQQISADTVANGKLPNRVYELQRGGSYRINSDISNYNWTLRIHANDSTTSQKPVVMFYPSPTSGNLPGQFISVRGDVYLKNIVVLGYNELCDTNLRSVATYLIRAVTPGWKISIDSCILSNSYGCHIRIDSSASVIRVTNTIFANMGYLGESNLGNGRAIDLRNRGADTIIIQNCTFMNLQDRVVRNLTVSGSLPNYTVLDIPTGILGYFKFDHNTLVNSMSFHGILSLGTLGTDVIITNNLLIDPFALGNDTDATRQNEFLPSGERDTFGNYRMTWILSFPNSTTQWTVSNNYYGISDSGQAFYNQYTSAGVTGEGSPLTWHINSRLGADSVNAFKKIKIVPNNVANLMTTLMRCTDRHQGGIKQKIRLPSGCLAIPMFTHIKIHTILTARDINGCRIR